MCVLDEEVSLRVYSCPNAGTSLQAIGGEYDSPTSDGLFKKYYYHRFPEIIFLRSEKVVSPFSPEKSACREGERVRVSALQSNREKQTDGQADKWDNVHGSVAGV